MKKIYIALILIFLIVVIIVTIVTIFKKTKSPTIPSSITPTSLYPTKIIISPPPTPTLIPIAPFTGVLEVTIPQSTIDTFQQEQNLRKKTPVEETYFTVTFDYSEAKFMVVLKEPKAENKLKFEAWKAINYPAIPIDRFTIK